MRSLLTFPLLLLLGCQGASEPLNVAEQGTAPAGTHYSGRVAFNVDDGSLAADLVIRRDPDGTDQMPYLLNGSLEIEVIEGDQVVGWNSEPMGPGASWNQVMVDLDPDREPGSIEIRFLYAGIPAMPESQINQIGPGWVELSVDSAWHPVSAALEDEFTIAIELGLPTSWTVVAPGRARVSGDGFELVNDEPHVDITFAAAPDFDVVQGNGAAIYHRGTSAEVTNGVLTAAAVCRTYLDQRFGAHKTLPDAAFVIPERKESGYARKNFISLTNVDARSETNLTGFLCHELSHFWSSGAKPLTVDNWLNEGFATLVAARAVRELFGEESWEKNLASWEESAGGQPSIWTPDNPERRPFAVNYRKAPLALVRLESEIGVEAFDTLLARYMTNPINDTPALLAALEEEAGAGAREWFEAVLAEDDSDSAVE